MAIEKLTLDALTRLDGGLIKEAIEQELRTCRLDCEDRPGVDKPRKVVLTINVAPNTLQNGHLGSCEVTFDVDHKLPKKSSPGYDMKAGKGGLFFNELSREDVRQLTIDDAPRPSAVGDGDEDDVDEARGAEGGA